MKTTVSTASSATYKLSYDDESKVLTVVMAYGPPKNHGETLRYKGVPRDVFEDFMIADSKGKFFNAHIRNTYEED